MADTALENAQARRDVLAARINSLNQELHDLQGEIRKIDQWIELWHTFAKVIVTPYPGLAMPEHEANGLNAPSVNDGDSNRPERARTTGNPKKEVVAAEARKIIEEVGEPVSRTDLFRLLNERGVVIEGKDPEQVLSTMLWRTRETVPIARVPSGGYWLAERQHEASGYMPEHGQSTVAQLLSTPIAEIEMRDVREARHPAVDELSLEAAEARFDVLEAEIAEADRLYHGEDAPKITDEAYDDLRRELDAIQARFPEIAMHRPV